MKAIVALMLVAATSAAWTPYNFDKTVGDYLRQQRNIYAVGDVDVFNTNEVFPTYTTYTLAQLYSHPLFQKYVTLPLFQYHLTNPAFQRFVESQYFQKYWTVQDFQQFFTNPALFYKYIYPVVAIKFQTYGTFEKVIVVPEVYRQYVPEYVTYFVEQQQYNYNTVSNTNDQDYFFNKYFGGKTYFGNTKTADFWTQVFNKYNKPASNNFNNEYLFNKVFNGLNKVNNFNDNVFNWENVYSKNVETVFNKPTTFDFFNAVVNKPTNFDTVFNKNAIDAVNPLFNGKLYNANIKTALTKMFTILEKMSTEIKSDATLRKAFKDAFGIIFDDAAVDPLFTSKLYNVDSEAVMDIFSKVMAVEKIFFDSVKSDATLRKIVKDAFGVNIDNFTTEIKGFKVPVVQDTIQNVVDPITGNIKVVEEKVVKPVNTEDVLTNFQGDLVKDAVLRKVILKKELYNKV